MTETERIEKIIKEARGTRLTIEYFHDRKTYKFGVSLYKTKVWVVSAYGKSISQALDYLIKHLQEKEIIK